MIALVTLRNFHWAYDDSGPYWTADAYSQGEKVGRTGNYYSVDENGQRPPKAEQVVAVGWAESVEIRP